MRVRRVNQNSAAPIDSFQRCRYIHSMGSENNDVAFGRLLLRPGDGAWTEIGDKICQCLRTSGVGHNDVVPSVYQMTAECASDIPRSYKSYFHDSPPGSVGLAKKHELTFVVTAPKTNGRSRVSIHRSSALGVIPVRQTWATPPSFIRSAPVMYELWSDARKTAALAISSARASRPIGIMLRYMFTRASRSSGVDD